MFLAHARSRETRGIEREDGEGGRGEQGETAEASGNANDRKRRDAEYANAMGDERRISLVRSEFQAIRVFLDAINHSLV